MQNFKIGDEVRFSLDGKSKVDSEKLGSGRIAEININIATVLEYGDHPQGRILIIPLKDLINNNP
jgi:small-conductance mechanosensitive channel